MIGTLSMTMKPLEISGDLFQRSVLDGVCAVKLSGCFCQDFKNFVAEFLINQSCHAHQTDKCALPVCTAS